MDAVNSWGLVRFIQLLKSPLAARVPSQELREFDFELEGKQTQKILIDWALFKT